MRTHFKNRIVPVALLTLAMLAYGYWLAGPAQKADKANSSVGTLSKTAPTTSQTPPTAGTPVNAGAVSQPALPANTARLRQLERDWTANARPTEHTSLLLLDLTKIPTEKVLRMAGQLGEELIPTTAANPASTQDATTRAMLEQTNLNFGKAIQDWNLHNYDQAYERFLAHLSSFPNSPWAAEAELHLGCFCQHKGSFDESQKWFESSKSRSPTGHAMNSKAELRLGALAMEQGKLKIATEHFASLRAASDTPAHGTYASYWIMRLSLMKQKQTAMLDCAQKSLAEVCAVRGKPEAAIKIRALENTAPEGFNLQQIEDLATQFGLTAHTVLTSSASIADMPLPFIAHYGDEQHFVTVLGQPKAGKIRLFDTRVGHADDADYAYFQKHWSGYAAIFGSMPNKHGILVASAEGKRAAAGGCCGEPREPDDLACSKKAGGGCYSCAMPTWNVNPINMNLSVVDTPMWWDAPYGESIHLTLT